MRAGISLRIGGMLAGFLATAWVIPTAHASILPVRSQAPRWKLSSHPPCRDGWDGKKTRRRARARCAKGEEARPIAAPTEPEPRTRKRRRRSPPRPAPVTPAQLDGPSYDHGLDADAIVRLDTAACHEQLDVAGVAYRPLKAAAAPSVAQPIRLEGPIRGVTFRLAFSRNPETDRHAIWDCRLAVAMIPLAAWLHDRGVDEVDYFSVLRGASSGKPRPRSLHGVGLALDLRAFYRNGARHKVVETYPEGRLEDCSNSRVRGTQAAIWTGLVCTAVERRGVHTLLTPDHDRAHEDHLHLDLKPHATPGADLYVSFAGS